MPVAVSASVAFGVIYLISAAGDYKLTKLTKLTIFAYTPDLFSITGARFIFCEHSHIHSILIFVFIILTFT